MNACYPLVHLLLTPSRYGRDVRALTECVFSYSLLLIRLFDCLSFLIGSAITLTAFKISETQYPLCFDVYKIACSESSDRLRVCFNPVEHVYDVKKIFFFFFLWVWSVR